MVFPLTWKRFSVVRLFLPSLVLFTRKDQLFTMMKCEFLVKKAILCNTVWHSCLVSQFLWFCQLKVLQCYRNHLPASIVSKLDWKDVRNIAMETGTQAKFNNMHRAKSSRHYHNRSDSWSYFWWMDKHTIRRCDSDCVCIQFHLFQDLSA